MEGNLLLLILHLNAMRKEYNFDRKLMGSDFVVALMADSKEKADEIFERMSALGDAYEQRFSRFLDTSELSLVNNRKTDTVSPEFLTVTLMAQKLFFETHGVFNPLLQVSNLGYTKDFSLLADSVHTTNTQTYDTDFSHVEINDKTSRVVLAPTQKLDFGGFLKGHVAEVLSRECGDDTGCIVNLGGDIFTRGVDATEQPFVFSVYNPVTQEHILSIPLQDSAIATSGTYKRTWKTDNGHVHHILESETKKNPDTDIISATILSSEGYRADAYATVALVLGSQKATHLLTELEIPFVFITKTGEVIHSHGLT